MQMKAEKLEERLFDAEARADSNKAAADILTEMINSGKASIDPDGNVKVLEQISKNNYCELDPEAMESWASKLRPKMRLAEAV